MTRPVGSGSDPAGLVRDHWRVTAAAHTAEPVRLGLPAARRIAIAAQGLDGRRPTGTPGLPHLRRLLDRIGLIQIDSVNVLARSHRLVLHARLGAHDDEALLRRATERRPRRLVECWAHEASFVPPEVHRLMRFRMGRGETEAWGMIRAAQEDPETLAAVRETIATHGPLTARELERRLAHGGERRGNGYAWNWTPVKRSLEYCFWHGEISSAGRTAQFERRYAPTAEVLPPPVATAPDPEPREAFVELLRISARAQGVATTASLRDYFRLSPEDADPAIAELAAAGEIVPALVGARRGSAAPTSGAGSGRAGTTRTAGGTGWWLHAGARTPRRTTARALLSPFDSLIWHRPRTAALFGFDYRLEIYVPGPQRVHGYYVLPFLLGDRLVARVDLKADRDAGALLVQAAHAEPDAPPETPAELAAELAVMAGWLGLHRVEVRPRGDLAPALTHAVG